jgi:hypothetical protein
MPNKESEKAPFDETETDATEMTFDDGGVPLYVGVIWVCFLIAYLIFVIAYALPDWKAWTQL